MAQKVNIVLVDDIDESEATQTVTFGLDGTDYMIDLNDRHADELRDALAGYIGVARKVTGSRKGGGGSRRSAASTASTASGPAPAEVREWARENGHDVPERGRIPSSVREAYDAAH